jgi:hypothetical protein
MVEAPRLRVSAVRFLGIGLCVVVLGPWAPGVGNSASAQGRGGAAVANPRANAAVDLTGTWVSIVTEDWRWRMRTPPKGDYASLPLTPAATKVADGWDPARDTAAGEQCRAYGAPAIMRVPGRVRIGWENDTTLKVEAEAGTQTRLFHFGPPPAAASADWQGTSVANWIGGGGGRRGGGAPARQGALRVVTTNVRPGYIRKNGVPYSANARVTEHFHRIDHAGGDSWLIVTTLIEDPQYLNTRFQVSSHFKKVPDGSAWNPTPCSAT